MDQRRQVDNGTAVQYWALHLQESTFYCFYSFITCFDLLTNILSFVGPEVWLHLNVSNLSKVAFVKHLKAAYEKPQSFKHSYGIESISEQYQDVKLWHAYSSIHNQCVFRRSVDPTVLSSPHLAQIIQPTPINKLGYNNVKLLYCKLMAWALCFLRT